jgi:CelD/BcsL family acetyltransferase involved in cellulose biosynthesis
LERRSVRVLYLLYMAEPVVLDSFVNLDAKWQELLGTCIPNHIFLTAQWQRAWWQVFGSGCELILLSVHDDDKLVGIAPIKRKDGKLSFIGSTDVCDYMDFIARHGWEDYVFSKLMDYLEPLEWKSIELESLLPQSLALKFLVPLARQKGHQVEIKQMNVSPQLLLPSSWEDYLALLKTKDRHELRRKLRRLEQTKTVNYYTITGKEQLHQAMESFFELFQLSNAEKAHFMTDRKKEFFMIMVSSLAEKGSVRLSFMEVGGSRTSSTLCFDYNNDIYLYNSAYDPKDSSLSVSLLLKVFNIRDAINTGKKRFDFLSGGEPYKYDLGGQDVPLYQCVISRS